MGRTLVGGVGHHNLCDFSFGPALCRELQAQPWPADIIVEDLSYGPVIVYHRLGDEQPPFARWILAGAVRRGGTPGAVSAYRWDGVLPQADEIQARVAEGVAGVIGLDSLVIVTAALGAAPAETLIVEVEPLIEAFGDAFSPPVARALDEAATLVRALALDGAVRASLRPAPLAAVAGGPKGTGSGSSSVRPASCVS
jgi:hydrogenase maturation protease